MISIFPHKNIFYKIYKLFLRSYYMRRLTKLQKTCKTSEDFTRFVKINSEFLFGHNELVVISVTFWITFAFDSSLGIFFWLKSSFKSFGKFPIN